MPAGQYAKEALESLHVWDEIQDKISYGTNVTQVLNWVVAGSAEVGVVYATDAAINDQVEIIETAKIKTTISNHNHETLEIIY